MEIAAGQDARDDGAPPLLVHYLYGRQLYPKGSTPAVFIPGSIQTVRPQDLPAAECVIVHLPSILINNDKEQLHALRRIVPAHQVWVASSMESAQNYPALLDRDFLSLFDLEMSYRQSADIWQPYIPADFERQALPALAHPGAGDARRRCCAFVSSTWDGSGRREYMTELMRNLKVDSFGRFKRNKRLWWDRGTVSKLKTLRRYTYTLAFENSLAPDYVTEKFFEPLLTGTIPVYLGAPNIGEFAPGRNCYVDVADFPDPAGLADYLSRVDPSEFHRWRGEPLLPAFRRKLERIALDTGHRLGELVRMAQEARRGHALPRVTAASD